jgi:hypothetical protein
MRTIALILICSINLWAQENKELKLERASSYAYDNDPNIGVDQWRLVPHLGWRKFAPVDAFYFDWLDYRKSTRWRYFTW